MKLFVLKGINLALSASFRYKRKANFKIALGTRFKRNTKNTLSKVSMWNIYLEVCHTSLYYDPRLYFRSTTTWIDKIKIQSVTDRE